MRRPAPRLSLRSWLLLSYLTVLVLPLAALVGSGALAQDLRRQTLTELRAQGEIWSATIGRELDAAGPNASLADVVADYGPMLRVTRARAFSATRIIDASGTIRATSGDDVGETLSDPEVLAALDGTQAHAVRKRAPVGARDADRLGPSRFADVRIFVATPIWSHDRVTGVVLVSRTPREEVQTFLQMGPRLQLGLGLALAITLGLALGSMHLGSRSLSRLARAAHRIAAGARRAPELNRLCSSHVHEVAATARAVETMRARMQARLDDAEELAANVAHEFRTPIATLRGTFELLHDDTDMPATQRRRFIESAVEELDRLVSLVSGLLALARAERPHDNTRIVLDAVLRRVVARHPGVAHFGRALEVRGDARQLELVVDNLLANARQHAGPTATIDVRAITTPEQVVIHVTDDGPGIAPNNLARIFDRFFTTDRTNGLGLGLPLARLICQAHGGTLQAQSRPGQTTFTLTLPRAS